ncbi:hypothetical protein Pcinc_022037 [Petrolisthes cinctipes]|uniref:Uncharacterized protein n=1 Tax=Petrolisthes cinctipes TaxID=88211 RepID=A0AAE1FFG5_PETCI|nr:hypothetical protein Pcinc_022037 [Petrolisthes cinctipes]
MYVQECVGVVLDLCTPLLHPTYTTNVLKLITNQQCDYVQSDVSGIVLVSSHQGEEVEVENVIHPEVDEPISGRDTERSRRISAVIGYPTLSSSGSSCCRWWWSW